MHLKVSLLSGLAFSLTAAVFADTSSINLSNYVRVGRYSLPEPTRTSVPEGNLLAQEASAVTYNKDTDTLFVVGDGGRTITQVTKTGQLIDSMVLASGSSAQGTYFYDPEGLTYIGNNQFVMVEERDRRANLITYTPGTTLASSATVTLGTFAGNSGIEGLTYDPASGGYIFVKENSPKGIFQSTLNFANGTASNGSASTSNSVNLFDPNLLPVSDFADVFALSNITNLQGTAAYNNLLVLSQESGVILEVDRSGNVLSSLTIQADPGSLLSVANQQHEGLTMDLSGNLYVVNENGGGDIDHPELWVYAQIPEPSSYAAAAGLAALGFAALRRRRSCAA